MHTLNNKIVKFEIVKDKEPKLEEVHEALERPEYLAGSTYKVKPSISEHALYITINDIVLNKGTEYEKRVPYEIFINCKNMENYQWIAALTRLISAIFRKGGDISFLVDELAGIFDPSGGYYKKGGVFMPSLVAEVGHAIKQHMYRIGYLVKEVDTNMESFLNDKKQDLGVQGGEYPESATLCPACNTKAVMLIDGCSTCLNCGDSKCG